jgi:hypothetical protein
LRCGREGHLTSFDAGKQPIDGHETRAVLYALAEAFAKEPRQKIRKNRRMSSASYREDGDGTKDALKIVLDNRFGIHYLRLPNRKRRLSKHIEISKHARLQMKLRGVDEPDQIVVITVIVYYSN